VFPYIIIKMTSSRKRAVVWPLPCQITYRIASNYFKQMTTPGRRFKPFQLSWWTSIWHRRQLAEFHCTPSKPLRRKG